MSNKTVFVSYRRDGIGKAFARSVKQELTRHGYDVFFDVDSIDSGSWSDQILTQVPKRAHFLLLLTPGALDRCEDENDWVRREFETAVQSRRNVVPIREESVDVSQLRKQCPAPMKAVFGFQIATVRQDGFEDDIEDLIQRFIPPHKAPDRDVRSVPCVVNPTRLHHGAEKLFGREQELAALDQIWNDPTKKVLTIIAFGGVGKTSLVIEWMGRQAAKNWNGFERVFDWSFFSQGTREKGDASADTFVAAALRFFGDESMADSLASAWDKGARLAQLVSQRRSLLVLDGIEPLQHPPGPLAGELKDPALATLLKGLARQNSGLCIVTTRERVTDLAAFRGTTAPEWELHHLSIPAAVELLKNLGVRGTRTEFEELAKEVKGHALTLNLLGRYLSKAHQGDIRKRDQVKFEKADAKVQGGYAFKTIGAYAKWFSEGGEDGARALAVLRVLGLFDRPADAGCLNALRSDPPIEGLSELLTELDDADWNIAVASLADCGLISVQSDESVFGSSQAAIDAHPLVREYFATQLKEKNPGAWRAAHQRLYEYLRDSTNEGQEPTLEDLQPLYQAVMHGCKADLQQEVCNKVFFTRLRRGNENYATSRLGAFGSDLGAVACFFDPPWKLVSPALTEADQAWLLAVAGFDLRALGRLTEALEPMRAGLEMRIKAEDWGNTARSASNLSELELTLGRVEEAVEDAEQSGIYADRSGDVGWIEWSRTTLANALNVVGRHEDSHSRFREAEELQKNWFSSFAYLFGEPGFSYCDLLLVKAERGAWQCQLSLINDSAEAVVDLIRACREVEKRALKVFAFDKDRQGVALLEIALDHLTLGRGALYSLVLGRAQLPLGPSVSDAQQSALSDGELSTARRELEAAVPGLRRAASQDHIPRGLLTRSWLRFLNGLRTGPASAQEDLDEAFEIAERGPMKLFMADIHLYRARLFGPVSGKMTSEAERIEYPWNKNPDGSPRGPLDDLRAARKLIEQCGYWRRKEELEDAEEAAKRW